MLFSAQTNREGREAHLLTPQNKFLQQQQKLNKKEKENKKETEITHQ